VGLITACRELIGHLELPLGGEGRRAIEELLIDLQLEWRACQDGVPWE